MVRIGILSQQYLRTGLQYLINPLCSITNWFILMYIAYLVFFGILHKCQFEFVSLHTFRVYESNLMLDVGARHIQI